MTFFLTALLLLNTTFTPPRLERIAPFDHPLNMVGGSPFSEIAFSNMRQWIFSPATSALPADSRVTVVFLFRPPDLFAGPQLQFQQQNFGYGGDRPAFPLTLWDPGYNQRSVGEGVVVLQLRVADTGAIENVRVVSDAPGLAAHTESAIRSWRFEPAVRNGNPVTGTVIVVASYLRPVLYPNPVPNNPYPPFQGPATPVTQPPTGTFNDRPGAPAPPPF